MHAPAFNGVLHIPIALPKRTTIIAPLIRLLFSCVVIFVFLWNNCFPSLCRNEKGTNDTNGGNELNVLCVNTKTRVFRAHFFF